MALSFGVGDYIEAGVLVAVIFLNVTIGFFQEFRAEKEMDSLRALSSPSAAVLRDGRVEVIPRYAPAAAVPIVDSLTRLTVREFCQETSLF